MLTRVLNEYIQRNKNEMKSYVDTQLGSMGRAIELSSLYLNYSRNTELRVRTSLEEARAFEAALQKATGHALGNGAAVLEIGPGQQLIQLRYFALHNQAVGIDLDFVPDRGRIADYYRMWRRNGSMRTAKTILRRMAGFDARIRRELKKQLGVHELPDVSVLPMDASSMSFEDGRFDAAYSRAVFEHLSNPRGVLRELRRVLKPGGAAAIRLHLYTCDSGCHDVRIFAGNRSQIPFWAHLRPAYTHLVQENTYLNRLRLAEWRELFAAELPGSVVHALRDSGQDAFQALQPIRAAGELADYGDEELLSNTVEAVWTKPARCP
jgi:SAM-dependent methyltransferase